MGVGSIVVGVVAFLFVFGGAILSVVPVAGTILSFGAPVLAIAGIVMGGLALSRAKREGDSTGLATAGIIVNVIAVIPAIIVALTCGLCNACVTAGMMAPQDPNRTPWWLDGGTGIVGPGQGWPTPQQPPSGPFDPGLQPPGVPGPGQPVQPPPAFPPPPLGDPGQPVQPAPPGQPTQPAPPGQPTQPMQPGTPPQGVPP